jgi:hypothetical protein
MMGYAITGRLRKHVAIVYINTDSVEMVHVNPPLRQLRTAQTTAEMKQVLARVEMVPVILTRKIRRPVPQTVKGEQTVPAVIISFKMKMETVLIRAVVFQVALDGILGRGRVYAQKGRRR